MHTGAAVAVALSPASCRADFAAAGVVARAVGRLMAAERQGCYAF